MTCKKGHFKPFPFFCSLLNYYKSAKNTSLTLEKLAREQRVSSGHLSRIINLYGNRSFNDFINEPRSEEAKAVLSDKDYDPYAIVSIGLECGLNSKSTFYAAFRKCTSLTPSQYRDMP